MNLVITIALLAAVLSAGLGGFKLGVDHEVASQARENQHIAEAVDAANAASAEAIAKIKPKYTTIQGKLEKVIETNNIYRDCKLDAVGMQLANQALSGRASPASDSKLPNADTSRK